MSGKMKKLNVKSDDTSSYWVDFDCDMIEYSFEWMTNESKIQLENQIVDFIKSYIKLTFQYGILIPPFVQLETLDSQIENIIKINSDISEIEIPDPCIVFSHLYSYQRTQLYPTILFTEKDNKIKCEKIVNLDLLMTLEDMKNGNEGVYSPPIRINFLKDTLTLKMSTDLFFLEIDNKKTKNDPLIGGKSFWLDNSELAFLNTPRFNSFLRELKRLCFESGATFIYENLWDNDPLNPIYFSENGVLFNGEVIYYEDVYDILQHKI